MTSNVAFINLQGGALPAVFNPATFKSSQVTADTVATTTLQVSSQASTNGIVDAAQIDAKRLAVATEAQFSGLLVPNSSCLATTYYVDSKIDALLGGTGIPTLLDSITEISTALNNDPDFAGTIGARVGLVEVSAANNANAIGQTNAAVEEINDSLLVLDTRITNNETDIGDLQTSAGEVQADITALDARVTTAEGTLSSHTTSIGTNTTDIAAHAATLTAHDGTLTTNTADIAALDVRVGAAETDIGTNAAAISSINTALSGKADKSNPTFTGTATFSGISTTSLVDNGNCTIKGNTAIGDQASDTLTVKGTATFNHAVVVQGTNVKTALDGHDTSISSINTSLAGKANDNAVVHSTGNETVAGIKTFSSAPKIGINEVATTYDVSVAINNLINAAPGTLDTLGEIATVLQANEANVDTILSSMVTLSGAQTISGAKAFSTAPTVPTQTQGDNSTTAASTEYVDTAVSDLETSLASTYQTQAGMTSYQTVSGMSDYLSTATAASTYQTQAGMSSYLTTASAASTYQPAGSYLTSSVYGTAGTWTAAQEFQADHVTNKTVEKYAAGTVSSNAFSINYSSNTNNTYAISPSSANNIALTITNVPTDRGTNVVNFTFLINTATNKQYISSLNVNGSSVTMKAAGGLANVSVHASATLVVQNIYLQMNGATVTNAITSVTSCF